MSTFYNDLALSKKEEEERVIKKFAPSFRDKIAGTVLDREIRPEIKQVAGNVGNYINEKAGGINDYLSKPVESEQAKSIMSGESPNLIGVTDNEARKEVMRKKMGNLTHHFGKMTVSTVGLVGAAGEYGRVINPLSYLREETRKENPVARALVNWSDKNSALLNEAYKPETFSEGDTVFNKPELLLNEEYIVGNIIEQVPNIAAYVYGGGVAMSAMEASAYLKDRMTKGPVDTKDALVATTVGTINGLIEKLGFDVILGKNPTLKKFVYDKIKSQAVKIISKAGLSVAGDMTGEYVQEIVPAIASKLFYDEGGTWKKIFEEGHKQGLIAASKTFHLAGFGSIASSVNEMNPSIKAKEAQQDSILNKTQETKNQEAIGKREFNKLMSADKPLPEGTIKEGTSLYKSVLSNIYETSIAGEDLVYGKDFDPVDSKTGYLKEGLYKGRVADVTQKYDKLGLDSSDYLQKVVEGKKYKSYEEFTKANRDYFAEAIPGGKASDFDTSAKTGLATPAVIEKPKEEIREDFKEAVRSSPEKVQNIIPNATNTRLTTEDLSSLSEQESKYLGIALGTAEGLEGANVSVIKDNIKAIQDTGVEIPGITPVDTEVTATIEKPAETKTIAEQLPAKPVVKETVVKEVAKTPEIKKTEVPKIETKYQEMTNKEQDKMTEVGYAPYTNIVEGQIPTERAIKEFHKYIPEIPIEIVKRIYTPKGGSAWGATLDGVVQFVANPKGTTPTHEVVHSFIKQFSTKKEYDRLMKAVAEEKGVLGDKNKREEWLADNFLNHIKEKKMQAKDPFIKRAIRWIAKQLKMLAGKQDKVQKFYDDIIKKKRPSKLKKAIKKIGVGKGKVKYQKKTDTDSKLNKFQNAVADIVSEVQTAQAGRRTTQVDEEGYKTGSIAESSTFPKWISEELRSKDLFDKVIGKFLTDDFTNLTAPAGSKQRALFDEIVGEIESRSGVKLEVKESAIVSDKGYISAQKVFEKAWVKLHGDKPPARLSELFEAREEELFKKGVDISFKEGKKTERIKSIEKRQEIRKKNAVKMKKLRKELKVMFKEKTSTKNEMKEKAFQFLKASLPASQHGKFINRINSIAGVKSLQNLLDSIDTRRKIYERKELVRSIEDLTKNIDKLPVDIQRAIIEITSNIELKTHTRKLLERLRTTKEFLDTQANDFGFPLRVLNELGILNRTPFEQVPTSKLIEINNKIEQYVLVGKNLMKSKEIREKQTITNILNEIEKSSVNLDKIDPDDKSHPFRKENITKIMKGKEKLTALQLSLIGVDRFYNRIDGRKNYTGVNYRTFKEPIDQKWNRWQYNQDMILNAFHKMIADLKMTNKNSENISLYAYAQQRGGKEKLMDSHKMTAKEISSLKLSEKEKIVYDFMRGKLDELYESVSTKLKEEDNVELGEVKNYFPMMTDFLVSKPLLEEFKAEGRMKSVPFGSKESRKERAKQKLRLDAFQVFDAYVGKATYFVEMDSTIKRLSKIASSEKYRKSVGELAQRFTLDWLDLLARKGGIEQAGWERVVNTINNNLSIAVLGLRLTTILKQPVALLDGAAEIGSYAFSGVRNMIDKDWRDFVVTNSSEMRDRAGGEPALREILEGKYFHKTKEAAMGPLKFLDLYTAGAVWTGAYNQRLDKLGIKHNFKTPNKEAARYADRVVRQTQASGNFKDLPPIMTGKARTPAKLFFKFQNFVLNRWSYLSEDLPDKISNNKKLASQQVVFVSLSLLVEAGISNVYYNTLRGGDDEEEGGFFKNMFKGALFSLLQTIPIFGQILSATKYGSFPAPLIESGAKLFDSLSQVKSSNNLKPKTRLKHSVRVVSLLLGGGLGIPTEQARQLFEELILNKTSNNDY